MWFYFLSSKQKKNNFFPSKITMIPVKLILANVICKIEYVSSLNFTFFLILFHCTICQSGKKPDYLLQMWAGNAPAFW